MSVIRFMLPRLLVAATALAATALVGCKSKREPVPDRPKTVPALAASAGAHLERTLEAASSAAPEDQSAMLALALSEAEPGRLPDDLVRSLASIQGRSVELSQKETILLKGIKEIDWTYACPAGMTVFKSVAGKGIDNTRRVEHVYRHCEVASLGWLTEDEAKRTNGVYLMVGLVAFQFLNKREQLSDVERKAITQFVVMSSKVPETAP